MQNKIIVFLSVVILGLSLFLIWPILKKTTIPQTLPKDTSTNEVATTPKPTTPTTIANPASVYCVQQGGKLDIKTNSTTGGQYGLCTLPDKTECEEWAYYRKECPVNITADTGGIKTALINKGLNLTGMKLTISKDTGKYAQGGLSPINMDAGGGYVFAAKVNGDWKIVADGNGQINCEWLVPYPDFPSNMIPECVGSNGNIVQR